MTGSKTELKFELKSICAKASLPHRILLPPTSFVCLFHHLVLFYFLQGGEMVPAPAACLLLGPQAKAAVQGLPWWIQWLRLYTLSAGGPGSIPGQESRSHSRSLLLPGREG